MPDDYRDALLGPPRPAPDLAAIRARRAAITPGPRGVYPSLDPDRNTVYLKVGNGDVITFHTQHARADATFDAAAPADIDALLAEVERLRAELAVWETIREPAYLWADCRHALQYGDMFPDEQGESYSDAYDAKDEIEGDLYDAIIARIPADWTPTAEQAPWRPEYHPRAESED